MIKLGTMSLNVRNTTATEFAEIVSDLGLDVIELHSSAFESTDLDYLRDLKMDLMKKGLPIGYIGISNNFGRPVEEHPDQISLIKKWIDVASFMSCPIVRVFAAYLPEDCTDEEAIWPPMISGFKEVAEYGITVNAVCPGLIDTEMVRSTISDERKHEYADMFPVKRLGQPSEVADLVSFLASDQASYITGASIDINGGDLMI